MIDHRVSEGPHCPCAGLLAIAEAHVRELEAGLQFYADECMWRADVLLAHVDRGEIARAALAGRQEPARPAEGLGGEREERDCD